MGLLLLASYPKSGNTWMRAMLCAWQGAGELDINDLGAIGTLALRARFDDVLDIDGGDLTVAEIDRLRPEMHRRIAATGPARWFKTHEANFPAAPDRCRPFTAEWVAGVVLMVRDPRDVAPSFAAHAGAEVDAIVERMANRQYRTGETNALAQLPQLLSSWSGFYESWLASEDLRLILVRFEDMLADPGRELARVLGLAGETVDAARLARAVEAARFENLGAQERERGFGERPVPSRDLFFRKGKSGGWRDVLSTEQVRDIETNHRAMMVRLGYLP